MGQLVQDIQLGKTLEQNGFTFPIPLLEKVHDTDAESESKPRVTDKAGHDVGNQPVAFQCRHQRLNTIAYIGRQGGIGQGQESQWGCKCANDTIFVFTLDEKIDDRNSPGKKYQGLIEVRKRSMTDTEPVRFRPAHEDSRTITGQPQNCRPGGQPAGRRFFKNPAKSI